MCCDSPVTDWAWRYLLKPITDTVCLFSGGIPATEAPTCPHPQQDSGQRDCGEPSPQPSWGPDRRKELQLNQSGASGGGAQCSQDCSVKWGGCRAWNTNDDTCCVLLRWVASTSAAQVSGHLHSCTASPLPRIQVLVIPSSSTWAPHTSLGPDPSILLN